MIERNLILGAILAGGRSSRFGGDKAEALFEGRALLQRVADALALECARVIVVGRDWPGLSRVEDLPRPDLGPLGGLLGALRHAQDHGFEFVLTSGCDLPRLPPRLATMLHPAPATILSQPTLALWPARLAEHLADHLARNGRRSIRGWIDAVDARQVIAPVEIANVNTPADLARLIP